MRQAGTKPKGSGGKTLRPWILTAALFCVSLILWLLILFQETELLISSGAVAYRNMRLTALCASGIFLLLSVLLFLSDRRARRKEEKAMAQLKAEEQRRQAVLSGENGRLDEETMTGLLASLLERTRAAGNRPLQEIILSYQQQMDQMNRSQAKLHHLLSMNGITNLQETEELLDRVEQNLFRNLRKSINWIEVSGTSAAPDMQLRDRLDGVLRENDDLLSRAYDLLRALTDYVNHQDSDHATTETMDILVQSLREQMEEGV